MLGIGADEKPHGTAIKALVNSAESSKCPHILCSLYRTEHLGRARWSLLDSNRGLKQAAGAYWALGCVEITLRNANAPLPMLTTLGTQADPC